MTIFQNLTIRSKLLAVFAGILCCTVGLGLFAKDRLTRVMTLASGTWEHSLPAN